MVTPLIAPGNLLFETTPEPAHHSIVYPETLPFPSPSTTAIPLALEHEVLAVNDWTVGFGWPELSSTVTTTGDEIQLVELSRTRTV